MLDKLYENIGGKIKNLAKWMFIVEAIGSIITAITFPILSGDPDDYIFLAFLMIIFGPIVAFVSSWILYAFGQLVEDVGTIRCQVQNIKNTPQKTNKTILPKTPTNISNTNKVFCKTCGADITLDKSICHVCKSKIANTTNKIPTIVEIAETQQNDICETCGADISSDTSICHVCGQKIK